MVNFEICEGNPGALMFLIQAYQLHMFRAERAFQRMQDNGIRGDKLYIIWNDCCGRDTGMALNVMIEWPIEKIVEHINYDEGRGIPVDDDWRDQSCQKT